MFQTARNSLLSWAAIILAALALAGCRSDTGKVYRQKFDVFGTIVGITIRDADEATARKAMADIQAAFARMHRDWHAWKPGELSRLNAALAAGRAVTVSPFLLPLIEQGRHFERISDGLFNPAIGAIIAAWGFHADELPRGTRPPLEKIRALAARHPSMMDLVIDGALVSTRNTAVSLDFGGFAKGEAVDRAMAILKRHGIRNAIVNAGGDLDVIGDHGGRPWRAGIRDPKDWAILATIDLKDGEALYTSGNYERYREYEGIRYAHIIDPRTGMPVDHIISATVVHTNGALADAAATALTVAGPQDWPAIARKMGVSQVMLVDKSGTVYMTRAMQKRIHFIRKPERIEIRRAAGP